MIQPRFLDVAPAGFDTLDMDEGNRLLVKWGHRLGELHRPFSSRCYVMLVDAEPVSLAMSASSMGTPVAGYQRRQVVELARLCSAPGHSWATRVMIRVWREVFGPRWPDWRPEAAISYHQNAHHTGNIYRFDGWEKLREDAGHPAGKTSTWSHSLKPGDPAYGPKTLWLWRYRAR